MPSLDLGDSVLEWNLRNKCCQRLRLVLHIGHPQETEESDRVIQGPPYYQFTGRIEVAMDLQADKKVTLTGTYTDEVGNSTSAPVGSTVTYTVDDPTIINLTDNGDGTAVAAATGTLGTANVHAESSVAGTADLQIVVVAGDAERFTITAGEPEEVTPDEPPVP